MLGLNQRGPQMKLLRPRVGTDVLVRHKRIPFSYWPTFQGRSREGLLWTLFASDPWFQIEATLENMTDNQAYEEAYAFLIQARDFFKAATHSEISAAKPLLFLLWFPQSGEMFGDLWADASLGTGIKHGVSEKLPVTPGAIYGDANILRIKTPTARLRSYPTLWATRCRLQQRPQQP